MKTNYLLINDVDVDDELHCLLVCKSLRVIRSTYLPKSNYEYPTVLPMILLMSSEIPNIIKPVAV